MHSVTGYELAVRLQASGQPGNRQRILVRMTGVPDGHPDQQNVYGLCFEVSGTPGTIVPLDQRVRFEGDGTYGLAVTASTGTDASTGCTAGPTASGSFTVRAPTAARFTDRPLLLVDPRPRPPFNGLVANPPPGTGGLDLLCARDPRPLPDGSLTGTRVVTRGSLGGGVARIPSDELFPGVGRWACVARGTGGGVIPGAWSAATPARIVQTGFYGAADGRSRLADHRPPTLELREELGRLAAGGRIRATIRSPALRGGRKTVRTRVGRGGRLRLRFRVPLRGAGYRVYLAFGGTRFVAARASFLEHSFAVDRTPGGAWTAQLPPPCGLYRC